MTIAYDGTAYHGWQRQVGQATVQERVESALSELTGAPVSVTASGRTDEGVHAAGQAVSFACATNIPCEKLPAALNARLPDDIRAVRCRQVPEGFCARKSAKRKTYAYRFYLSSQVLPHMDRYALRIETPPDIERLTEACAAVEGTHDFRNFYCLGSSAKTTVRTVYSCCFAAYPAYGITPPTYELTICGDGFLYKMVRLIAGALLSLSREEITLAEFGRAVRGEATSLRKVPAPSKGLTLCQVEYDGI